MNPLHEVMTTKEAGIIWGIPSNTLLIACRGQKGYPPRFTSEECRQSGATWLVTRDGMLRLYGEPKTEK